MNNEKKFYAVECKCGHVGRRYYISIIFPIVAESKEEAAAKGKAMPRCKHNHKDCIKGVNEVNYEEYCDILRKNDEDPYLKCKCIQEQRLIDLSDRIVIDNHFVDRNDYYVKEERIHPCYFGKEKIKNPRKFIKYRELEREYNY